MELLSCLFSSDFVWHIEKLLFFVCWFCILLKVCIRSMNLLMELSRSLKYRIIWSASKDNLTSSLPTCIPFIKVTYYFCVGTCLCVYFSGVCFMKLGMPTFIMSMFAIVISPWWIIYPPLLICSDLFLSLLTNFGLSMLC
jgi:hypothetical protein